MSEAAKTFQRVSPLAGVAKPGRYGANPDQPGVTFTVRHPASIVTIMAHKDKGPELAAILATLKGCSIHWAGADQYYAVADGRNDGALHGELKAAVAGLAALSDQSHGRLIIRLSGAKVRQVLAKGTPVDLHRDAFAIGKSAVTQMAHVGVHLTRTAEDSFELSVFRGFSESFWHWLTSQAEEFGYQVT